MKNHFLILLLFSSLTYYASHIVGGEIIYDDLGGGNYRITLKVYRDCGSTTQLDGVGGSNSSPALLTVIESLSGNSTVYDIGAPVLTSIPPSLNNPCIKPPTNICVEEGVYTYTLHLPPVAQGYYIVYQRCCRNPNIVNLVSPVTTGSTYYTRIPGPEEFPANSSPHFNKFPPLFLCNEVDFSFDHAATDPDGDQLVYALCPPFIGLDACCATIGGAPTVPGSAGCNSPPPACPTEAPSPPYLSVNFASPYSGSYPIASNPSLSIDPVTGLLTGKPSLIGQFVVGVCVQEYRNNVLIGTHYRDFQFNVVPCVVNVVSSVANQSTQCQGQTIHFNNSSITNIDTVVYKWDFGDPNISSDTSSVFSPVYTYQDTGQYLLTLIINPGKLCTDTAKKIVFVYPVLDVSFAHPKTQCLKNNAFLFTPTGQYAQQATFSWDFSADGSPGSSSLKSSPPVSFDQPGLFFVKLQARQFACRDSFTDSLRILRPPQAIINALPALLCDPSTVSFGNGSTSDLPLKYSWKFSNGGSSTAYEPSQVFSPGGTYQASLTVITQSLCSDTSSTFLDSIVVRPKPTAAFTYSPEVTSIFDPQIEIVNASSNDVITWAYDFGDGQSSFYPGDIHLYRAYGNYTIVQTVSTLFGCRDSVSHLVKILPEYRFWVPNTFTPDGNAVNDVFMPTAIGVENYNFEIYDRWGELIFKTSRIEQGWDGRFKGRDCVQDIYVWRITFKNVTDSKDEIHCGHVLILRNL